jgi:peptide/nickel transport system substrate-binding protein
MKRCRFTALIVALLFAGDAYAQKIGGILRLYDPDSPASMSIHEEATVFAERPMMNVFNNLVIFDPQVPQASINSIIPDLATSWSWSEDGKDLAFELRRGVTWHDGQPFTSADVKCTWDMLAGTAAQKFRVNPRKSWYRNLDEVTTDGDAKVIFHLHRPQPAFIVMLATGWSPVYPCHVSPAQMRQHPIGTGPFKFVEFKPNESIKLVRSPDYWKPGRPYLDGIEFSIMRSLSTAVLAFAADQLDMTFPASLTPPLLKQVQAQVADAACEMTAGSIYRNLLVNRDVPPFDNPDLRRAMALTIDRKAFIDILSDGQGDVGGIMQPPPSGLWGMPPEMLATLPGFDPDVEKNRGDARSIMQKLGYGPDKRLKVKVSTRDIPYFRDPAVLLLDQLKQVYIDAELETIDTTSWFPKILRKDYTVGMNLSNSGDDPDESLYLYYGCGGELNANGYCSAETDALIDRQSTEADAEKRKQLVWEVQRKLAEDGARPTIFYTRTATCWHPRVKGLTIDVNSIFNGPRMEDLWLDR